MSQVDTDLLHKIQEDHKNLVHMFESAFTKDEHGDLELAEHRTYHKEESKKIVDKKEANAKLLSSVLSWAVIGLLTVIGNALVHAYVIPILTGLPK